MKRLSGLSFSLQLFNALTLQRLSFHKKLLSFTPHHGSSQTKNFEDAVAHAQGSQPLACCGNQQMPAVRQRRSIARGLSFLWLLSRSTGVDGGGKIMWEGPQRPDCMGRIGFAAPRPLPHSIFRFALSG
jgi:hypothetical protein